MSRRPRNKTSSPPATASIADFRSQQSLDWPALLPWIFAFAVLALTLIQTLVSISPDIHWDIDPRQRTQGYVNTMIGPSLLAVINTLSVLTSCLALLVPLRTAPRPPAWSVFLLALGSFFAVMHLPTHADNAYRCAAWIAAAFLGLAAMRLAGDPKIRRWMLAAVVAMILAQAIRSVYYVWIEHPMTVEMFKQTEDQFLQARGWIRDSPQHMLYLRRLTDWQATGSFGLSNVFGTVMASMTVIAAAIGLSALVRRKFTPLLIALPLLGMGLVTVGLSKSKGAMLAMLLGFGVLGLVELHRLDLFKRYIHRLRSGLIVLAVLLGLSLPLAAVAYRGMTWKPGSGGEISLLVRAQYFSAAGRMLLNGPHNPAYTESSVEGPTFVGNRIIGLSPAGFAVEYLRAKSPYNPEEIISTHNVFVDYVLMLGLGGLAWTMLLLAWLLRGAWHAVSPHVTDPAGTPIKTPLNIWVPTIALGVVVFMFQYFMQLPTFSPQTVLLWMLSAAGFMLITGLLNLPEIVDDAWVAPAALAAAFVVLVHSQIEMAFFQAGAMTYCWVLVGLAGASIRVPCAETAESLRPSKWRWLLLGPAILMMMLTTFVSIVDVIFTVQEQDAMAQAGDRLAAGDPAGALQKLDEAWKIAPNSPETLRWRVRLLLEKTQAAIQARNGPAAIESIKQAGDAMESGWDQGLSSASFYRTWSQVAEFEQRIGASHSSLTWEKAIRQVLTLSPYSLPDHLGYASYLWKKGRFADAARIYQRALELSDMAALDPAKQLSDVDRAVVLQHIEQARAAAANATAPAAAPAATVP